MLRWFGSLITRPTPRTDEHYRWLAEETDRYNEQARAMAERYGIPFHRGPRPDNPTERT